MTFDELRDGEAIFLDANIFVYHFLGLSQQCKELLWRRWIKISTELKG